MPGAVALRRWRTLPAAKSLSSCDTGPAVTPVLLLWQSRTTRVRSVFGIRSGARLQWWISMVIQSALQSRPPSLLPLAFRSPSRPILVRCKPFKTCKTQSRTHSPLRSCFFSHPFLSSARRPANLQRSLLLRPGSYAAAKDGMSAICCRLCGFWMQVWVAVGRRWSRWLRRKEGGDGRWRW
jgi:hypothetical protein